MPDLMHPQDLQKLFVQMKDLQASGRQGGGFSARIRTATDRWLWMSGVGRVLTDDDGAIIGGIVGAAGGAGWARNAESGWAV